MKNTRIFLLLLFHSYVTHGNDPRVQTEEGTLVGKRIFTQSGRRIYAFIGIPYAEPPRGNLRFQDPVAKKGWSGVRKAQKAGNVCIQNNQKNQIIGDEDCLVLNVYTPRLHSVWNSLLPVMVFIHGGAYAIGEGGLNMYTPRFLLDRADIMLVTINYRLGVFGFLSTGDMILPGNFGLKDQRLALQWIHRNIHEFGGDSKRITLFGQSAGAGSVSFHVLSESSQHNFQRYIMQSGTPLASWAYTTNPQFFDYSVLIASKLNCPTTNTSAAVECLRHQPPTELFAASQLISADTGLGFWPTIEPKYKNAFLTDAPPNLLRQGKFKNAPVITGITRDEGLVLSAAYYVNDTMYQALRNDPEKEMRRMMNAYQLVLQRNDTELAAQCRLFYFGKTLPTNRTTLLKRFTEFITDYYFAYPLALTLDVLRNGKQPVYLYMYDFIGRLSGTQLLTQNNDVLGVNHGDEMYYLLDYKDVFDQRLSRHRTRSEKRNTHILVDFWTSFAMNGEPKSKLLRDPEVWIDASRRDAYIKIGNEPDPVLISRNPSLEKRIEFWRKLTPEFPI